METVNQDIKTTTAESAGESEAAEGKTFTQEEMDRTIGERLARERAKYADYEELKEKAAKFDKIEEESKTELQKAQERAEGLQKELDILKKADSVRSIREEVASETGVPVTLLTGDTKEDCEAQAKAIMLFAKPESYPEVKDSGEVRNTRQSKETRDQFADWINKQ